MTLKQDQGHQSRHDLVDPKQGYNHVRFEKCLTKRQHSGFCQIQKQVKIAFEFTLKSKMRHIHDLVNVINKHTRFQLNQVRT